MSAKADKRATLERTAIATGPSLTAVVTCDTDNEARDQPAARAARRGGRTGSEGRLPLQTVHQERASAASSASQVKGVLEKCGINQTKCTACLDKVSPRMTFSTMTDPLFMDSSTTSKVTVPTNTLGFTNGMGRAMTPTNTVTTTNPSSSQINATIMDKNLIPIYCSILAAVVVGLVAYIVFKRWNSCKQNKQAANNRTVNQTPSPEGEKLHSDSGISVDSQSLQEQQQAVKASSCPYANLPTHKQKELENLLKGSAEDDTDWCNLASLLGYQEGHIDAFRQGEHPVQELLSDWGNKDSATVDALCTALRKINREDIAECLSAEPTATSAV
uniref:Nerve growth factor receptor a (TNFR superfamily, member 16) n=1 Tax=Erpetoichthys calabaricus TaxID=27687 RepID=A0A8C4TF02_ERPCA